MIAIAFLMLAAFVALSLVGLMVLRGVTLDYEKQVDRLHEPGTDTLVYEVPSGRDPVELTIALGQVGFTAVEYAAHGTRQVLVDCPHGRSEDRPRVRAAIERVYPTALAGGVNTVRFADEF